MRMFSWAMQLWTIFGRTRRPVTSRGYFLYLEHLGDRILPATARDVAHFITHSPESDNHTVARLYLQDLHRPGSTGDILGWSSGLHQGATPEAVEAAFKSSAESLARYGGATGGYVMSLYEDVLGRAAGPAEVSHWLEELGHGWTPVDVARFIASSPEHRHRVVAGYYENLLDRKAGDGEILGWVASIDAGLSYQDVLTGFIASDEYVARRGGGDYGLWLGWVYRDVLGRRAADDEVAGWLSGLGINSRTIASVVPTVTPGADQSATEGTSTAIDLGSFVNPGGFGPWTVTVDWGDGTSQTPFPVTKTGALSTGQHAYADPGVYPVTVTVTDGYEDSDRRSFRVTVRDVPPVFTSAPPDQPGSEGTPRQFELGTFGDAGVNDGPWAVAVDWGDGTPTTTFVATSSGAVPGQTHTFATSSGSPFTVTVTLRDKYNAPGTPATFRVSAENVAPVVTAAALQPAPEGTTATFGLGSFTDPGADSPWGVSVDWGDGSAPTSFTVSGVGPLPPRTHLYADNGGAPFMATVTVRDKEGAQGRAGFPVAVANVPPELNGLVDQAATEGTPRLLSLGALADPGADNPWTVTVNWGDGTPETAFNVNLAGAIPAQTHAFAQSAGSPFRVTVTVRDKDGARTSGTFGVTVANVGPSVTAPANRSAVEALPQTFSLGSFSDGRADGPWTVTVNWGDGTPGTTFTLPAAGAIPPLAHTFATSAGSPFTATVTVVDKAGAPGSASFQVAVPNVPPVVTPPPAQGATEGAVRSFNLGSFADAPGDGPWHVAVNWGDGDSPTTFTVTAPGSLPDTTHTFADNPGSPYVVTMSVTDRNGVPGSASFAAVVANAAPANLTLSPVPASVREGDSVTLSGSFTDPGTADTHTVSVTWGDGSPGTTVQLDAAVLNFSVSHVYLDNQPGNTPYAVGVTVSDKDGGGATETAAVTVTNAAPTPTTSNPVRVGTAISLSGAVSDPGRADHPALAWTVTKDGATFASGTGADLSFRPDKDATYVATLTATDKDRESGSTSQTLNVYLVPQDQPDADQRQWTQIDTAGSVGLAVSPDNKFLVYRDGPVIRTADRTTGQVRRTLALHGLADVQSFTLSPTGKYLASTAGGNVLRITDFATAALVRDVAFNAELGSFAWQPREDALIVNTNRGVFRVLLDGTQTLILPDHRNAHLTPDGRILIASYFRTDRPDSGLDFLDAQTLQKIRSLDFGHGIGPEGFWVPFSSHRVAIDPTGRFVAESHVGQSGGYFHIHRIQDGAGLDAFDSPGQPRTMIGFSADGELLVTIHDNSHRIEFFRFDDTGAWIKDSELDPNGVSPQALSPDGSLLYVSTPQGIQAVSTPRTGALHDRVQTIPLWGPDLPSRPSIEATLQDMQARMAAINLEPDTAAVYSLISLSNDLADEGHLLTETRRMLDGLRAKPLPADFAQKVLAAETAWQARYDNFRFRDARSRAFMLANPDTVSDADLDRFFREHHLTLDLWAYDAQTTSYGPVADINLADAGHVRLVNVAPNPLTAPPVTHLSPQDGQHQLELPALVTGLDLSKLTYVTTRIRLRFGVFGPAPTIAVYRDGATIASDLHPTSDGIFDFADPQGVSALLIRRTPDAVVLLQEVTITTDPLLLAKRTEPLSPMTNRDFGLAAAPQWESGVPYNYIDVGRQNGVHFHQGGVPQDVPGSPRYAIDGDPNHYVLHQVRSVDGGTVAVSNMLYINETGVHLLPTTYWTQIGAGSVITFPGGPPHLVLQLTGNASYDVHSPARVTDRYEDARPGDAVRIVSDVLVTREGSLPEGWQPVPPTVPSRNAHARAGDTVNELFEIRNDGLQGGTILARVHVGQAGTVEDPFVAEFAGTIMGLERKALSVNVTLQHDRDVVTIEVSVPDAPTAVYSRRVQLPRQPINAVDTFQHYLNVILLAHKDDPDGGAALIASYARSEGRTLSISQLASLTGKSSAQVATSLGDPQLASSISGIGSPNPAIPSLEAIAQGEGLSSSDAKLLVHLLQSYPQLAYVQSGSDDPPDMPWSELVRAAAGQLHSTASNLPLAKQLDLALENNADAISGFSAEATDSLVAMLASSGTLVRMPQLKSVALDPQDPRYTVGGPMQLIPSNIITDQRVRASADRVALKFAQQGLDSNVMGTLLDADAQVAYSSLKTVLTSLQNGRTLSQAMASAQGIAQVRWAQLTPGLLSGFLTSVALDIVSNALNIETAETTFAFNLGLEVAGVSLTLVLNKLLGYSATIAGSVGAIVTGVLSNPEQLASPENAPYLVVFQGKACFVPQIVELGLTDALQHRNKEELVALLPQVKQWYISLGIDRPAYYQNVEIFFLMALHSLKSDVA
jgi:WD40 repeat protein